MSCQYVNSFSITANISIFQSSREQLAIAEFARSLLVIPKTLSVNAAQDATDLVAKLRSYHNSSQTKVDHAHMKWYVLFQINASEVKFTSFS